MLATPDLYNAAEQQVYVIGHNLSGWRRGGGSKALDETEKNLIALLEVCRELRARSQ